MKNGGIQVLLVHWFNRRGGREWEETHPQQSA